MDAYGIETDVTESDGRALIRVDGEVDLHTSQEFADAIRAALTLGLPELVVDLRGVTFISSGGVSALLSESDQFRRKGGRMVIRPSPVVARWFDAIGLFEELEMDWGQDNS